jgi:hypothetical protein
VPPTHSASICSSTHTAKKSYDLLFDCDAAAQMEMNSANTNGCAGGAAHATKRDKRCHTQRNTCATRRQLPATLRQHDAMSQKYDVVLRPDGAVGAGAPLE